MKDFNKDRTGFIGGSDIAGVMGLSNWETPLSIWAMKTGRIVKDLSDNEAVEMGTDLEPFVAKKFEQRSGKKVRVDDRDFTHPDYPYMRCHIDRWVIGEETDLEAKTCSAYKAGAWVDDEIPEDYQLQKNWNSGIMGAHRGKPGRDSYIAVLIGGQKFVWKPFKFDQELFDLQVARAIEFWENYVLKNVPPMAIANDKDTLMELFPESRPKELKAIREDEPELEATFNELALNSIEGKVQKKALLSEIDEAENLLRQMIGDDEGLETGQYKATWKSQKKTTIDTQKLKDDGLYDAYAIRGTNRVLRIVEKKGKK